VDQPQSQEQVQPVVDALRRLDPLLDIRWNPQALIMRHGQYDVNGRPLPAIYDGRWEVVRYDTPHVGGAMFAGQRQGHDAPCAVIYQVRGEQECYKPIGLWLIDFMQQWDSQQAHFRDELERMRLEDEREQEAALAIDEGAVEEIVHGLAFASKHEGGRSVWYGGGFDPAELGQRARNAMAPPNGEPALIPERTR